MLTQQVCDVELVDLVRKIKKPAVIVVLIVTDPSIEA